MFGSIYSSVYLSVCLFVSAYLPVCLHIYLCICSYICVDMHRIVCFLPLLAFFLWSFPCLILLHIFPFSYFRFISSSRNIFRIISYQSLLISVFNFIPFSQFPRQLPKSFFFYSAVAHCVGVPSLGSDGPNCDGSNPQWSRLMSGRVPSLEFVASNSL